jgi:hypothetical protein
VFAVARSGLPSPLKSPTATDRGFDPTANPVAAAIPPLPLPSSTDTLSEKKLATARAGLLSRLKSATATDCGLAPPPPNRACGAKLTAPPRRWHERQASEADCGNCQKLRLANAALHNCFSNRAEGPVRSCGIRLGAQGVITVLIRREMGDRPPGPGSPFGRCFVWLRVSPRWVSSVVVWCAWARPDRAPNIAA